MSRRQPLRNRSGEAAGGTDINQAGNRLGPACFGIIKDSVNKPIRRQEFHIKLVSHVPRRILVALDNKRLSTWVLSGIGKE